MSDVIDLTGLDGAEVGEKEEDVGGPIQVLFEKDQSCRSALDTLKHGHMGTENQLIDNSLASCMLRRHNERERNERRKDNRRVTTTDMGSTVLEKSPYRTNTVKNLASSTNTCDDTIERHRKWMESHLMRNAAPIERLVDIANENIKPNVTRVDEKDCKDDNRRQFEGDLLKLKGIKGTYSRDKSEKSIVMVHERETSRNVRALTEKEKRSLAMAEKKMQKKQNAELETQLRKLSSEKNVLCFMEAKIDSILLNSKLGIEIVNKLLKTQEKPEHERINYSIEKSGLDLPVITWFRKEVDELALRELRSNMTAQIQDGCHLLNKTVKETENHNCKTSSVPWNGSETSHEEKSWQRKLSVPLKDNLEPHVLICFNAPEFVHHVRNDGLKSVFERLDRHLPGCRPFIMVNRLDSYLRKCENEDFRNSMQQGSSFQSTAAEDKPFTRTSIDMFIHNMSLVCPRVGFRDVTSEEEGASHALAITKAVAKRHIAKSNIENNLSRQYNGSNKQSNSFEKLLIQHPIEDDACRTFMSALGTLPSIGPQVAHALAIHFVSLGDLMDYCMDPTHETTEKLKHIGNLQRFGSNKRTRIGPAAAQAILNMFCTEDENLVLFETPEDP